MAPLARLGATGAYQYQWRHFYLLTPSSPASAASEKYTGATLARLEAKNPEWKATT